MISVVIPAFNSARWIGATLESVRAQKQSDLEVIVIDDGSTDDSVLLVEREFPECRLVRTPNQGASRARNLGTSLASGEYIQYLDADDLLAEGKLQIQLESLEASGADVAYGDWQRLVLRTGEFVPGETIVRRIAGEPELDLFGGFWCPPAAYLFRRGIVDQVGGWNLNLPVVEDARFALDCALHGAQFVYCEGVMAYYRTHESGSLSTRSRRLFLRCCLTNAQEVFDWWRTRGQLSEVRRRAVADVCHQVATGSFGADEETFEEAVRLMFHACPGYVPRGGTKFSIAARWLGYRRAQWLGYYIRSRTKKRGAAG